jgi:hypothetical protein
MQFIGNSFQINYSVLKNVLFTLAKHINTIYTIVIYLNILNLLQKPIINDLSLL